MLARLGMLFLWCLILWGTLVDLGLLYALLTQGRAAVAELVLAPPASGTAAAWGNRVCGLLALLAWTVVAGGTWSSSRRTA